MPDANLPSKVAVALLCEVKVNSETWKDQVLVRTIYGQKISERYVQGGARDLVPAGAESSFEFETKLTTDLIDTAGPPPTDVNSLSYWIYLLHTLLQFPEVTFEPIAKNKDGDTGSNSFVGWVTNIVPMDKEEGDGEHTCIVSGQIKTLTQFKRTDAP